MNKIVSFVCFCIAMVLAGNDLIAKPLNLRGSQSIFKWMLVFSLFFSSCVFWNLKSDIFSRLKEISADIFNVNFKLTFYEKAEAILNSLPEEDIDNISNDSFSETIQDANDSEALIIMKTLIVDRINQLASIYKVYEENFDERLLKLKSKKLISDKEYVAYNQLLGLINRTVNEHNDKQQMRDWVIKNGPKAIAPLDDKILDSFPWGWMDGSAEKHPIDISYDNCHWVTNYEWIKCIDKHDKLWSKEITKYGEKLSTIIMPSDLQNLNESQRSWEKYMDSFYALLGTKNLELRLMIGREGQISTSIDHMDKVRKRALELTQLYQILRESSKQI